MKNYDDEPDARVKQQWLTPVLMSADIVDETNFMGGPNGEAQGRPDS